MTPLARTSRREIISRLFGKGSTPVDRRTPVKESADHDLSSAAIRALQGGTSQATRRFLTQLESSSLDPKTQATETNHDG